MAGVTVELNEDYLPLNLRGVKLGDLTFSIDGVRIAVEICEDYWVANRPLRDAALFGIDLVMSPSASHFAIGKAKERTAILVEGARFSSTTILSSNLLGCESGKIIFDGDSRIIVGEGTLVATDRFSMKRTQVVATSVDLDRNRVKAQSKPSHDADFRVNRVEISISGILNLKDKPPGSGEPKVIAEVVQTPCHELWHAISLALLDYAEKSSSRGFVVSLSGGADSSSVASLVYLMVKKALKEIGFKELVSRLALDSSIKEEDVVRSILFTVYQKTENSSQNTQSVAKTLAEELGSEFAIFDVQSIVDSYSSLIERSIGRDLCWESDDTALQNIQARVRAPSVWMIANLRGALLLTTGNRSELSVGYATMDGDMSGGLNPIGGISKPLLLKLLGYLAKDEDGDLAYYGIQPIKALDLVLKSPPTAELRPLSTTQTDEDDLMPYVVLQRIEEEFIYNRRSRDEIINILRVELSQNSDEIGSKKCLINKDGVIPKYSPDNIATWVDKYLSMFQRNQWKRERAAPSFHLDRYSLDPRSWFRFPILSEPL
jgi:NAD+ synthase (glutamine-hydrolysing)